MAANPLSTERLAIDEEARAIAQGLRVSRDRDAFDLITRWAVQPADLQQFLNQYCPHVVHFSGHGTAAGQILLSTGDGTARPVGVAALAELFRLMCDDVHLVMLNACYTAVQAQAIHQYIDFVIGTQAPITDEAATVFAAAFYSALGFGRTVLQAFDQAKAALMVHGLPGHDISQLLARPDADHLFFDKLRPAPPVHEPIALEDHVGGRITMVVDGLTMPVDGFEMLSDGLVPRASTQPSELKYQVERHRGKLILHPREPYLDNIRARGILGQSDLSGDYALPVLDIKVVNNTPRTIVLHEAIFTVAASRLDMRPIPVVFIDGSDLVIDNQGWGPLRAATLDLDLVDGPDDEASDHLHLDLGDIPGSKLLRKSLHGADIDIDVGRARSSGARLLRGTLAYSYTELDGTVSTIAHPVLTPLWVYRWPPNDNAGLDASCRYRPVVLPLGPPRLVLPLDGAQYKVRASISHVVAAGAADRFQLPVDCAKSSFHEFTLNVRTDTDDEVVSGPISLEFFKSTTRAWQEAFFESTIRARYKP